MLFLHIYGSFSKLIAEKVEDKFLCVFNHVISINRINYLFTLFDYM